MSSQRCIVDLHKYFVFENLAGKFPRIAFQKFRMQYLKVWEMLVMWFAVAVKYNNNTYSYQLNTVCDKRQNWLNMRGTLLCLFTTTDIYHRPSHGWYATILACPSFVSFSRLHPCNTRTLQTHALSALLQVTPIVQIARLILRATRCWAAGACKRANGGRAIALWPSVLLVLLLSLFPSAFSNPEGELATKTRFMGGPSWKNRF